MQIEPTGAVGARVTGIDLNALADDEFAALQAAFAEHSVLFVEDQHLTPEAHIKVAERWSEINVNRFFTPVEGYPQVAEVLKEPEHTFNVGGGWHTDHSYDQVPALGSMLYALELPPLGGDTMFASTCAAFESLSDGLKETLRGLKAVHSSRHVFGTKAPEVNNAKDRFHNAELATQDAVHPVVIEHPLSKRPSLYVNPGFTLRFEGWSAEESEPLLRYLYQHIGRPEHTFRYRWQPGSLAFWDNRATWHWAVNDYPGHRRLMHRITLEGEPLSASS